MVDAAAGCRVRKARSWKGGADCRHTKNGNRHRPPADAAEHPRVGRGRRGMLGAVYLNLAAGPKGLVVTLDVPVSAVRFSVSVARPRDVAGEAENHTCAPVAVRAGVCDTASCGSYPDSEPWSCLPTAPLSPITSHRVRAHAESFVWAMLLHGADGSLHHG